MARPRRKAQAKGKGKNSGYGNDYKLGQLDYQEIINLNNKDLISRAASEYANWMATEQLKKDDSKLQAVAAQIKEFEDEIKQSDEYIEIKEKLDAKFEELMDESLARFKEERKNLLEPYKEDIAQFKNSFKAAMDEINRRKKEGKLVVEGKIV